MNSAAALGTTALSASAAASDTIRIAVVGMNGRGKSHLQAYTSLKGVDLVAVCDIDDAVLAKGSKFVEGKRGKAPTAYKDLRKLLEDKSIDAISIATETLRPHFLSLYLYELAGEFSAFYSADKVAVDDPAVRARRLLLCARTLLVLETGLNLLGLRTLTRM